MPGLITEGIIMGLWLIILGFERVHGECFITEDPEGYRRPEA